MGWKGTVRSLSAAVRAAERDAKRRQRELERQHKQYEKMQELEQAAYEVEVYENHIAIIQSIHKECSPALDWNSIASSPQPKKPTKSSSKEDEARLRLDKYKPGIIDRIFKKETKKRAILTQEVDAAIDADEKDYKSQILAWGKSTEEWKESINMAELLLKGEAKAKIEVINNLHPFSEISNLGSSLTVSAHNNGLLEAVINVHGIDIVPSEAKTLLKSGKLSVKDMPKGMFNEIYQDYVCSSVLRIANELFSIIPDQIVIVTAIDELLNSKTGHLEEAPILSVAISRSTLSGLNMEAIDPSDSMSNFIHNMSFKKTKGFDQVDRINPENIN